MVTDLWLFFLLFAKVALVCGFAEFVFVVIVAECAGVKIVRVGIEQVSGRAVSHNTSSALSDGNKPARNLDWRAA